MINEFTHSSPIVLIVEEHALLALDLETILLNIGVGNVHIAASADEALALLRTTKIDAAIVDLAPRNPQSVSLANAFRVGQIPFALASTFNTQPPRPAGLERCMSIEKPFTEVELKKALTLMLGSKFSSSGK